MARNNAKQKRDIHTQQFDDLETPEEGDCQIGDVMAVKFAQAMYCCGTVRWIGKVPNVDDTVLGLEMVIFRLTTLMYMHTNRWSPTKATYFHFFIVMK